MRKKILVLDDKIAIAKVLSIYLASDYDCIWLPNGIEGVKWLQEGNIPDLIISDIRMPEMRGDEFLEWIKSNQLFKHIPVVMLSKELDLKYGREFSFFLDMKILFKTLTAFVQKGDV